MMSNRRQSARDAVASMKSPTPLTPKKKMTWKELESSIILSDKKKRATAAAAAAAAQRPPRSPPRRTLPSAMASSSSSMRATRSTTRDSSSSSGGGGVDLSPKPPSSSDAATTTDYITSRRNRLAKKSHLLGNRGKCSPNGWHSPQQSTTPSSLSESATSRASSSTPQSSTKTQPSVRKTGSNSVAALLLSPTNFVKTSSGTLDFGKDASLFSSSAKKTQQCNASSSSSSRTPPLVQVTSTPRQKRPETVITAMEKCSSTSAKKQNKTAKRRVAATTRTPPPRRASSTTPTKNRASLGHKTPEGHHRTPLKPLPLSVERERNRQKQHSSTNTPGSNTTTTRRNLDKRSARLMYSNDFGASIDKFRQQCPYVNNGTNHEGEVNLYLRGNNKKSGVAVYCRKRPLFDYESNRGDFDVVSIDASTRYDADVVIVHNCTMHNDMRQRLVKPISFSNFSAAFDEHCTNENLYQHVAAPLVQSVVKGGIATLLMYGQTGSGKTHTMGGIEEQAADDLFRLMAAASNKCRDVQVSVQFVELSGSKLCKDLLHDDSDDGLDVRVVDQEDGTVGLLNAVTASVASPKELIQIMARAKRRRATEATDKNGVSSRSHAVCQITVTYEHSNINSQDKTRGMLTLIDCAGSERRNDSLYHSSIRQKESTQINASLFALKECIRARAANKRAGSKQNKVHVPYRASNLTRILRETLEQEEAQLCVIATVAPNATDTEHTLETLKTVSSLVGTESSSMEEGETQTVTAASPATEEVAALPPKQWDHAYLKKWMTKKKLLVGKTMALPEHINGRVIMRMSCLQLRNLLYDDADYDKADKAEKLFKALRAESDRIARLQVKQRIALSKGRRNTLE